MVRLTPNLLPFKITELFAFVAYAEEGEGIMAAKPPGSNLITPLIGADMARVKSIYTLAETIKKETGIDFRVLRFSVREDITEKVKSQVF